MPANPALAIQYEAHQLHAFADAPAAPPGHASLRASAMEQATAATPALLHLDVIGWGLYGIGGLLLAFVLVRPMLRSAARAGRF